MVGPEEGRQWRLGFPSLWEDVLCILGTGTEADIVWNSTLGAAEDRERHHCSLICSPQTIIMQTIKTEQQRGIRLTVSTAL